MEEYLKIANGTAFGKSKQEVLNAIKGLQLTAEQSQEIRENLKNHHLNRRAHDGNVVALVVTVLQKLKNDHHSSSFFHTKPVRAYEEAKSGLQNIAARTHADVKPKGWLGSHKHHYFFLPAGSKLNKTSLAEALQAGADIRYVDLRGEDLRGLDLSEAGRSQKSSATISESVDFQLFGHCLLRRIPSEGLTRPAVEQFGNVV